MKKLLAASAVVELGAGVALLGWPSATIAALVPIAPLLLTVMPLEELLKLLFGLLR